jgi:indolepyruvate ferredoxin oxidoreductase, alpha subunit
MLRTLTRVSHALSPVIIADPRNEKELVLERNPERLLAVPSNVVRMHKALNKKQVGLKLWAAESGLNKVFKAGQKCGIIAAGITYTYAREVGDDFAYLKISAYPFGDETIKDFVAGLDEVWVLEEGEPVIEEIARKYHANINGKLSGHLSDVGELGPDALIEALGKAIPKKIPPSNLIMRPPVLCAGCSHRELYKSLKAAGPNFTTGDIGCYTLGAMPPLRAMDTCLCMGASISKAAGMSQAGAKRVAAVIGDSTFLHTGVPALISAVYNKANIVVIIMDNSATAMTGHQPTTLTGITAKGQEGGKINLEDLCRACGATSVEVIDPINLESTEKLIREKLDADGVNVIISRRPCILIKKK